MIPTSTLYNTIYAGNHTHEVKLNIAGRDYGIFDENEKTFSGFTAFKGLERMGTGPTVIRLMRRKASSLGPDPKYERPNYSRGSIVR